MSAAYDTYDYPSYWKGREYEHESEKIVLKDFLSKIPKIKNVLEVGCGYGRLVNNYLFRAKKVTLTDPSARLLSQARKSITQSKKTIFIQSSLQNLPKKIKSNSQNLIVMIRVLHHIEDIEEAFKIISKILTPEGYLILEFANKKHGKATVKQLLKGNLTYSMDIFPSDKRSKKSIKKGSIAFLNYHPDVIEHKLKEYGFSVVAKRSVSNIRAGSFKNIFPLTFLLTIERYLQTLLAPINFGPSVFILARKK